MEKDVPKEILGKTRCHHAFSCLATGKCGERGLCEGDDVCASMMLSLQAREREDLPVGCPQLMPYGNGHFYLCPVRVFLHSLERNSKPPERR